MSQFKYNKNHDIEENNILTSGDCMLCDCEEGVFTDIGLKKFIDIRNNLEELLQIKLKPSDVHIKTLCHKCVFKIQILNEFHFPNNVKLSNNNKLCSICGEMAHSNLKITLSTIADKLKNCHNIKFNALSGSSGLLCATCFCKLELLEELKICALKSSDMFNNCNFTSNKTHISVKHLVESGLIKVARNITRDRKMYIDILKVCLVNNTRPNTRVNSKQKINSIKTPLTKSNNVRSRVKSSTTPKIQPSLRKRGKEPETPDSVDSIPSSENPFEIHDQIKEIEDFLDETNNSLEISEKVTDLGKRSGTNEIENVNTKRQKLSNNEVCETIDGITPIGKKNTCDALKKKVPVIVLMRENFDNVLVAESPPSLRKRALKLINKTKDSSTAKKSLGSTLCDKVIAEIKELKENIPEEDVEIIIPDKLQIEFNKNSDSKNIPESDPNIVLNGNITDCDVTDNDIVTLPVNNTNDKFRGNVDLVMETETAVEAKDVSDLEEEAIILPKFLSDNSENTDVENDSPQENVEVHTKENTEELSADSGKIKSDVLNPPDDNEITNEQNKEDNNECSDKGNGDIIMEVNVEVNEKENKSADVNGQEIEFNEKNSSNNEVCVVQNEKITEHNEKHEQVDEESEANNENNSEVNGRVISDSKVNMQDNKNSIVENEKESQTTKENEEIAEENDSSKFKKKNTEDEKITACDEKSKEVEVLQDKESINTVNAVVNENEKDLIDKQTELLDILVDNDVDKDLSPATEVFFEHDEKNLKQKEKPKEQVEETILQNNESISTDKCLTNIVNEVMKEKETDVIDEQKELIDILVDKELSAANEIFSGELVENGSTSNLNEREEKVELFPKPSETNLVECDNMNKDHEDSTSATVEDELSLIAKHIKDTE